MAWWWGGRGSTWPFRCWWQLDGDPRKSTAPLAPSERQQAPRVLSGVWARPTAKARRVRLRSRCKRFGRLLEAGVARSGTKGPRVLWLLRCSVLTTLTVFSVLGSNSEFAFVLSFCCDPKELDRLLAD